MSSAGTSKQKEVFDENAGSRKLERQLKRLTSVTTGTDIKGLAEKENVFIETDIVIPAGMETDYEKWCEMHQDDELPPLPVDGEDDLPAMGEDELFWFQAYQAELNKHKEAENENRMIREKLEQTQARSAELRVLRDKREEELQRKIDNEKERHRADNEKERQRADNEKEHQRTDNEKERQSK
ncbi:hypothetical protein QR680_011831 [Steinernema hermaphroditum]|uniref:Uncharacterized protein n=1 Tax=Steinernema hermaphroditum TaxID=289476 RepID=A0AA39HZW1_9BILA|nr:hypothetical protein QR680_011831 [Steinernema hermaphroditum]